MACESKPKKVLLQSPSTASISGWLHRPYISSALRERLSKANLLILPIEDFPNAPGPVFPAHTEDLFNFLKDRAPEGVIPEICIEDQDYKELALHHDILEIAELIFSSVVAPVVVALLIDYIRTRLRNHKHAESIVKMGLTIENADCSATRLFYEGPAAELEQRIVPVVEAIHRQAATAGAAESGAGVSSDGSRSS